MTPARAEFYDVFRHYLADPEGGAAGHAAEFVEKVRGSDMRYAGEPLDVAYFPLALGRDDLDRLGREVEGTLALAERATRRLLERPEVLAREYGWGPERLRVVAHDPGYPLAVPCARFDSYWDGAARLRFLEINTDGTSGMTNVERVTGFFLESAGVRALAERFALRNFDLRARVLDVLLACYAAWRAARRPDAPGEPRIAIVDWRTVKTSAEFRALCRYFEERGLRATIADPRDLRFDGRALRDGAGELVDLIYRRVVSTEFFAAPAAEVAAMTEAYLAGAVCVVGSFRSDVAFDKRMLGLLTDPEMQEVLGLSGEDRDLAARVLPWTRTLRPGPVLERARRERERLVLKPGGLYEGRGVRIGVETPQGAWEAALAAAAPGGDHVVQEREIPPELTVELVGDDQRVRRRAGHPASEASGGSVEGGRWRPRALYLSLGEYAFGGRLAGFNARVASTLVLSADDDERLLPVVRIER